MPTQQSHHFRLSLRNLLRLYTIDFYILLALRMYHWTGSSRIVSRIVYWTFQFLFLILYFRVLRTLYYSYQPDFDLYAEIDLYYYTMTRKLFDNDRMILISMVFYGLYIMGLIHFAMFRFVGSLTTEAQELSIFINYHHEFKFTLLDCLFGGYSKSKYNSKLRLLVREMKFPDRKLFQEPDFESFLRFYKLIETVFFWPTLGASLGVGIIFLFIYLFLMPLTFDTLTQHCWMLILICVGILSSTFIITISTLILTIYTRPWLRYSSFLTTFPLFEVKGQGVNNLGMAIRMLCSARKLFFESLKGMKRLNRHVIARMITFSVILTLVGNIIFTTECFLGDMNIFMQIYLPLISGFQFGLFFTFINFLSVQSIKFYRPSKFFLSSYASIALETGSARNNFRDRNLKSLLTLSRFIEDIYPRKPFTFTFGPVGRINRKYLFASISVYATLFLYLVPYVLK